MSKMNNNGKIKLELTPEEISILSNGLICLIRSTYEGKSKIYDITINEALDRAAKEYQKLNEKICGAVPGME